MHRRAFLYPVSKGEKATWHSKEGIRTTVAVQGVPLAGICLVAPAGSLNVAIAFAAFVVEAALAGECHGAARLPLLFDWSLGALVGSVSVAIAFVAFVAEAALAGGCHDDAQCALLFGRPLARGGGSRLRMIPPPVAVR